MPFGAGDDMPADTTQHRIPDGPCASSSSSDRQWSLDDLPVAVLVFHGTDVVAVNEQWTALTGLDLASSKGEGWLTAARRGDRAALRTFPRDALDGDDSVGDWRVMGPGGRGSIWVQARARRVEGSAPDACLMTLAEIPAQPTADAKLVHLATHDALTGLLNRAAFISDVENALHYATIEPTLTAVLFVDLDRFKEVNDRLGHQAGDTLLAVACRRIVASLRPTELAGRLGGDEVGVLCPDLPSRESAVRLAERILMALEEPFTVHDEVVLIGASIGLAFSGPEPLTATALVHLADLAMYRAKEQGRARCVVHTEGDQPKRPTPRTGELTSSIAHVAVSVTRDEREVNDLWRHSIDLRDDPLSQRLARIGQLLHAANAALRDDSAIG